MYTVKQYAINKLKDIKLVIEPDENVGFYLLVYDLSTGECLKDFLYFHDQLDDLYHHAQEDYGIDKNMFIDI
jgi:hypothetical protein